VDGRILSKSDYQHKVQSLVNLPTLPIIATEIIRITQEDKLSINQILPVIEKDPPLALKVLKFANSPYYGLKENVRSLRHAMVIIGVDQLSQLAMAFSVIRVLHNDNADQQIPWRLYWEHSSATGYIAQLLQENLGIFTMINPYSLGLLHDIGKLILFRIDPENYITAYNLSKKERIPGYAAEAQVFGFSHEEIGKWIAEKWDLPHPIMNSIAFHHKPAESDDVAVQTSAALVNLADKVANLLKMNFGSEETTTDLDQSESWGILKTQFSDVEEDSLAKFVTKVQSQSDHIRDMIQLIRK
jgi:putative nucleotidyltransferase with HDIG domain